MHPKLSLRASIYRPFLAGASSAEIELGGWRVGVATVGPRPRRYAWKVECVTPGVELCFAGTALDLAGACDAALGAISRAGDDVKITGRA